MHETLQHLLDAAGIPIGAVAKRSKVSIRTLYNMRNGAVRRPRSTTLARLAKVLGVDVARLTAALGWIVVAAPRDR